MEKPAEPIDRRGFLSKGIFWGALSALGGALAWIFGDVWTAAGRFSSDRWVPTAPWDRFPLEGIFPFPEYKLAIVRTGQRAAAISLECTHLGCLLNVVDRGFFCPCHGSDFGPMGQVYSGPARKPLPWHELTERGGRIWVRLGSKLDSAQWLEMERPHSGESPSGEPV